MVCASCYTSAPQRTSSALRGVRFEVQGSRKLPEQSSVNNRLLASMISTDFEFLGGHMALLDLPRNRDLSFPQEPIEHCWFIEQGLVSLVAISSEGHETEAGIVGHEGMVDLAAILGAQSSPLRCVVQIAGCGYRLPASILRERLDASSELRAQLNKYAYESYIDVAFTALANASFTVEERLARWLLMCADRLATNCISLTHECLAIMLNVRRAGVTVALRSLQKAGFVDICRGRISISDRLGLEHLAQDTYRKIV